MADGGSGDSGNQSDNEETRPRRPNRSKRSDASHLFLKEVKAAFDRATEVFFHRITGSSEGACCSSRPSLEPAQLEPSIAAASQYNVACSSRSMESGSLESHRQESNQHQTRISSSSHLNESASASELRRVFGSRGKRRKGTAKGAAPLEKKQKVSIWKKESFCFSFCGQILKPTVSDELQLRRLGLGNKRLEFDANGDAVHVHKVIITAYPPLQNTGGYTLLRLDGKRLIVIDDEINGVDVVFLRQILKQAKLYIRPLQRDILSKDVIQYQV